MIRFIMKSKFKDDSTGYEGESFFTIDGDIEELERQLTAGGFSENGYKTNELVGVEVLRKEGEG